MERKFRQKYVLISVYPGGREGKLKAATPVLGEEVFIKP